MQRRRFHTFLAACALTTTALAQEVHSEFLGVGDGWLLGRIGSIEDLDGDGVRDLLLGAHGAKGPGPRGGALWVVSGASGQPIFPLIYGPPDFGYGHYVRSIGDLDGDGVEDFADGVVDTAPCLDGEANLYSGATGALIVRVPAPSSFFCLEEAFGYEVVELGDLDQDGYPEVAITFWFDPAIVIVGGPDGALKRLHRDGNHGGVGVGRTGIAKLGDVDGDGVSDYVIGYSGGVGLPPYNRGLVIVFSGASGEELHRLLPTDEEQASGMGKDVAPMGDLDLDGIPDYAVALPYAYLNCQSSVDHGFARLHSGADGSLIREIESPHLYIWGGECPMDGLEGGEDVNGDGFADLMASMKYATAVYSGATGAMLWYLRPGGDRRGTFALLGDLDGDGLSEMGHGDYLGSFGYNQNGKVTIYRGAPGDAYRICEPSVNSAGTKATLFLEGPISVGNDQLALRIEGAVPGATGAFLYGRHHLQQVLGGSELCIGAFFRGIVPRIGDPVVVAADGTVYSEVDMTRPPLNQGPLAWTPGATWTVQFRYQDPASPAGFAVSDAFEITFTP